MSLLEGLLFKKKSCLIQWRKNTPGFVMKWKNTRGSKYVSYYDAKV